MGDMENEKIKKLNIMNLTFDMMNLIYLLLLNIFSESINSTSVPRMHFSIQILFPLGKMY